MLLPGVSQQLINLLTNALPSRGFSTLYMHIHFTIALYTLKTTCKDDEDDVAEPGSAQPYLLTGPDLPPAALLPQTMIG